MGSLHLLLALVFKGIVTCVLFHGPYNIEINANVQYRQWGKAGKWGHARICRGASRLFFSFALDYFWVFLHNFNYLNLRSSIVPCGKKRKRAKIATHKRKKKLRKNRHKSK